MKTLTQHFLRGLLVVIPLFLTFAFLYWLFENSEEQFRVPLELVLPAGWYIKGMGVVSALLIILLTGFLLDIYLFKLLFKGFENLMDRLPLVKQVYGSIRDLIHFLGDSEKDELQKVVALEVNGLKLIGFVTAENTSIGSHHANAAEAGIDGAEQGEAKETGTEKMLSVYLPMSYQVGGYLVYVPESRCEVLDMSANLAMRTVLTANIAKVKPEE